jgi:hypothetical protein
MFIIIDARLNNHRSCPEEYRELRRRNDDSSSDSDDDQWREDVCEQAMDIVARQRNSVKTQSILRNYCAYYDETLQLAGENNDTLCENKKREIDMKRKRQESKKKRDDDDDDSSDSDDDDDDNKRQALRKRELNKRLALRFIRKRMS